MSRAVRRASVLGLAAVVVSVSLVVAAVSPSTGSASTDRIAGADRYETAVEVAVLVGGGSLAGLDRLIVVSGESFPDGLAASGLAGFLDDGGRSGRTAILLTQAGVLPPVVADAIRASGVPADRILIVGGVAAVSDAVRSQIASAAGWDSTGMVPVTRIAGEDRYETAAAIVNYVLETAGDGLPASYSTVLVASGEQFPDALAAGSLAYRNGHLLLLSPQSGAPAVTLDAVAGLTANCVVLIGGTAALAPAVATQLDTAVTGTGCGVERIAGQNRYDTAAQVADRFVAINGAPREPLLASGVEFADALTTGPLAAGNRPLLLTTPDQLPAATSSWLQQQRANINQVLIIGGTNTISPAVATQVNQDLNPPRPTPPTTTTPGPGPGPGPDPDPPASFWATKAGGTLPDQGRAVSVRLADGSAIVTGYFAGTATFGDTILTSVGDVANEDVFVAKTNAAGSWEWATAAGGVGSDVGLGVSVLAGGSAIVTGRFNGTATFGATTLISAGGTDVFVAKISAGGVWQWATAAGGTDTNQSFGVSVLTDESAIVTGSIAGTATFSTTTSGSAITLNSGSSFDVFVAKISADGLWEWATAAGGVGSDVGFGVSVLTDGSAIVTGSIAGTATFSATTSGSAITLNSGSPFFDVFVAKISADGLWVWATAAGGTGDDEGLGVSVLADGSAIVTGVFAGTATFGTLSALTSAGGTDVFVAKISAGGAWVWATAAGGPGNNVGWGVSVLTDGSAIVTGYFEGTVTFGALPALTSAGNDDVFVAKVNAAGAWVWATAAGGPGFDLAFGVSALTDGSAIIIGFFNDTATFGATNLTSAGGSDVFVAKISATGSFG